MKPVEWFYMGAALYAVGLSFLALGMWLGRTLEASDWRTEARLHGSKKSGGRWYAVELFHDEEVDA